MASRLPLKSCTKMNLLTPHPSLILWLAPQSEETLVLEVSIFASPEEGPGVWASAFPRSKPTEASEVEICGVDALGQALSGSDPGRSGGGGRFHQAKGTEKNFLRLVRAAVRRPRAAEKAEL